ncbi:RNA polymerase subunit sigma-70 [Anaerobacillus alkalidiazotrophicus]|uniref:RNA polymerase subunit sigma-70 n=2 Tax=Anaerobacillus TaxID=704093 RepID=A0A1S2MBH8_9BACI|nr:MULTISPECIES: RNA polymerase subunit sigma-70 [Anaerobacillus]OIJ16597.1 RNA polymerase subunit sigma-70 [Anaerobacillus alkalilacustris]OIJ21970.1 RNA polymerase subunit sigma-70 [Anaerobacillus alkalidiazotrophicus]
MRAGSKQESVGNGHHQLIGVDFHDFIQKEQQFTNYELAEEYGISLRNVKELKRKLSRN